jgi:hypothetical protein
VLCDRGTGEKEKLSPEITASANERADRGGAAIKEEEKGANCVEVAKTEAREKLSPEAIVPTNERAFGWGAAIKEAESGANEEAELESVELVGGAKSKSYGDSPGKRVEGEVL